MFCRCHTLHRLGYSPVASPRAFGACRAPSHTEHELSAIVPVAFCEKRERCPPASDHRVRSAWGTFSKVGIFPGPSVRARRKPPHRSARGTGSFIATRQPVADEKK